MSIKSRCDEELVHEWRVSKSEAAVAELRHRYAGYVLSVVVRFNCRDARRQLCDFEIEEVAADVWFRLSVLIPRSQAEFSSSRPFRAWLWWVVFNVYREYRRDGGSRWCSLDRLREEGYEPVDSSDDLAEIDAWEAAEAQASSFKGNVRQTFDMLRMGLTKMEIADHLGVSARQVRRYCEAIQLAFV